MASSVDQKLLKQTKFPPEFAQKVDMQKVNVEVMKKWIAGKISEILGNEDDVVIELCFNLLEGTRYPSVKDLQIQLTGFLEKDTAAFCKELWTLCLSAQSNPQGVPKELLEAKKLELIQEKVEAEKAAEAVRMRREEERARDRDMDKVRQREHGERGSRTDRGYSRGRGDGRDYVGRGGGDYDRRPARDSRSPPPRRDRDTYAPRGGPRGGRWDYDRRARSPADRRRSPPPRTRPRSMSRTPPRRRRRSRSPSTSRSASPPRAAKRRRSSSSRSRSRSPTRVRNGRERGQATRDERGDNRAGRQRRSRSRSPRQHYRRRRSMSRSRSRSLSSSRVVRNGRRRPSLSRSISRGSRSRTPDRRKQSGRGGYRRQPSDLDGTNGERDGGGRTRSRSTRGDRHRRVASREPGPARRGERKRVRSMERYDASKRRRNTSSIEPEESDPRTEGSKATSGGGTGRKGGVGAESDA